MAPIMTRKHLRPYRQRKHATFIRSRNRAKDTGFKSGTKPGKGGRNASSRQTADNKQKDMHEVTCVDNTRGWCIKLIELITRTCSVERGGRKPGRQECQEASPNRKTLKIMGKNYPRVAPLARLKRVGGDNPETVIFVWRAGKVLQEKGGKTKPQL